MTGLNVYLTVARSQMLFGQHTAGPFLWLAVTCKEKMGLGEANICYLTQINAQTQREEGKWSSTGQKVWVCAKSPVCVSKCPWTLNPKYPVMAALSA